MFSALIIAYLFCGGIGAGTLIIACVSSLSGLRRARTSSANCASVPAIESSDPEQRALGWCAIVGVTLLLVGCLCLGIDLGRPERAYLLFVSPRATWISAGTFLLSGLIVAGAIMACQKALDSIFIPPHALGIVCLLCIVVGVAVMLYTGLFLWSISAVPAWGSVFVPALFVASSLSGGCAVCIISLFFADCIEMSSFVRGIVKADLLLICCEAAFAVAYIGWCYVQNGSFWGTDFSAQSQQASTLWWMGFVFCGIILPLLSDVVALYMNEQSSLTIVALVAIAVVVGTISLRASIVIGPQHGQVILEYPATSEAQDSLSEEETFDTHI